MFRRVRDMGNMVNMGDIGDAIPCTSLSSIKQTNLKIKQSNNQTIKQINFKIKQSNNQTIKQSKAAFTVLELLVASLLLSMLVTILTMIFNQSSIAWTTGVASMSEQSGVRVKLSAFHDIEDDLLPGLGQENVSAGGTTDNRELTYRTVSIFKGWDGSAGSFGNLPNSAPREDSNMRGRVYDKFGIGQLGGLLVPNSQINGIGSFLGARYVNVGSGGAAGASSASSGGMSTYLVGVRSWGPDGKPDTPDDITSYPEDAN